MKIKAWCNAVLLRESLVFQRNISPPSSGSNGKASMKPSEADSKLSELCLENQGSLFSPEDGGDMSFWNIIFTIHCLLLVHLNLLLNAFLVVSLTFLNIVSNSLCLLISFSLFSFFYLFSYHGSLATSVI
jgi:hypothetical protein